MRVSSHPDCNRKRTRLKNFDYSTDGAYFVTICTQNRQHFFGEIRNKKMILNACGKIVRAGWLELPQHYRNCALDEFVVMPNHFHGIIRIDNSIFGTGIVRNGLKPFPTQSTQSNKHGLPEPFPTQSKKHGLSEMIRGFKTFSSRRINQHDQNIGFCWQKSFYDRIIRDDDEMDRIREYILLNPQNWENDKNNS